MPHPIKFKTVFSLLVLLTFVNSICKDPMEIDGQCTVCGDLDILIQKYCYPKIRGCLSYVTPGPACSQCQNGYVLYQSGCIRQAVFNALNDGAVPIQIPPVQIDQPPTLSYNQIIQKIGQENGPFFTDANQQFLSNYPQLGKGSIKSVNKLDTKTGTFFITNYQSDITSTQYETLSILNTTNETNPIYIYPAEVQPKDPLTADIKLRQILGTQLTNFFIYEIRCDGLNYVFYYMNSLFNVLQIQFKRADIGPLLGSKLTITSITAADLAKEQLLKKYPQLLARTVLSVRKLQDFYSFAFDSDISASVRFTNYRFEVNKPIKTSLSLPGYDIYDYIAGFFDLFGVFNLFNPAYYACLNSLNLQVPQLKTALAVSSSAKRVARENGLFDTYFSISYSKLFVANYVAYALYTADNTVKILLVQRKPDTVLYSQKYNYNADPFFFKGYINATITSKVLLIPSIVSVLMKMTASNVYYYKVIYSPLEFMEFTYNRGTGVTNLLSYTVQNQNILNILGAVGTTPQKTPPQLYLLYLKKQKSVDPWCEVSSIFFNALNTVLSFVSHIGTYKAQITNSFTTNISQISNLDCYDFSAVNSQTSTSLDGFLRAHYNINGYTKILVQGKVRRIGYHYRVLYSNPQLKQIQFKVEQLFSLYNVIKTIVHNGGFEYVEPSSANLDYQKMVNYLSTSAYKGNKVPLLTETTFKNVRGFYNDGRSTNQILINKNTGAVQTSVYENQAFLPIPNQLSLSNLLLPGSPSSQDQLNLQKLTVKAQSTYPELSGAALVYADRILQTYKLAFKSLTKIYLICSGKVDAAGVATVQNLTPTSYQESDFSTCTSFDSIGRCLNCPVGKLEYQGSCWDKMEGCKVQGGNTCYRCNDPYILWDKKCKKTCADCFSL